MFNDNRRLLPRLAPVFLLAGMLLLLSACSQAAATTTTAPVVTTTTTAAMTTATSGSESAVQPITPEQAKAMLAGDSGVVLLDVRTAEEYAAGHIAGSQLLPYDEIENRTGELPADLATPIIVYCRSGRRSAIAAATLAGLGYKTIYDLGGIQTWPYETVVD